MTPRSTSVPRIQRVSRCYRRTSWRVEGANVVHRVALLLCSLLLATTGVAQTPEIKVMSFNLRGDYDGGVASTKSEAWKSLDGDGRRRLVLADIHRFDPDLLGVQEAFHNQMEDLAFGLPAYGWCGVGRDDGDTRGEYCGIFYRRSRFTLSDSGTLWLSKTPNLPGSKYPGAGYIRIFSWALLADTKHKNQPLTMVNTHWDNVSQAARNFSAQSLRDWADRQPADLPLVIMGDLNLQADNPAFAVLAGHERPRGRRLLDSYRQVVRHASAQEATYHGFRCQRGGGRIDFILASPDLTAVRATIQWPPVGAPCSSDHYPVTATLKYAERLD